jgi:glycosyltransferase involved in cell wall biosynthesis/SAM-dependent methyltransferase
MHTSALNFGKLFYDTYCSGLQGAVVHEVGAQDVNGSLRDVLPPHLGYVGIDFVAGKGVDIVLEDPYKLPFADQSLDVLVCSSCFEHSQFFWVVFLEMLRVLKPQGLLYLNVPSNGSIHRYPVDCWRFYPDSGRALEAWGTRHGDAVQLMESFVGERSPAPHETYESGGAWHDFVAVFVKDRQHADAHPARILDALPAYSNGYDSRTDVESRPEFLSPDHAQIVAHEGLIAVLRQQVAERDRRMADERSASEDRTESLLRANQELTRTGAELHQKISFNEKQLARTREDMGRQLAEREQALSALDRELSDQRSQLRNIREADKAQIQAAHARIEQILRSRSWRFMMPARKMMGAARRVRSSGRSLVARLRGAAGKRASSDAVLIRASGQFDEAFYRSANPDVPAGSDVIAHYCQHGWREGRDPSALFKTRYYLDTNPDVRACGINPFVHYIVAGAAESRRAVPDMRAERAAESTGPSVQRKRSHRDIDAEVVAILASGMFDEDYYRAQYPDLARVRDPIRHYCEHGWGELRNPCSSFNTSFYLQSSPDIRDVGINPFLHYVTSGVLEGRPARPGANVTPGARLAAEVETIRNCGRFDEAYYRATNPDLQPPPADCIWHYCEHGWREGRNPSDDFDTKGYLATYRDIRVADINPFWHYIVAGAAEFREPHPGSSEVCEDEVRFGPFPDDVRLLAFYAVPNWTSLVHGGRSIVGRESLKPHPDLGSYDPTDPGVLRLQAVLARRHGIHGFCFPVTVDATGAFASEVLSGLLRHPDVDQPFCVMLDLQSELPKNLHAGLLAASFQDPRYIRVEDRPLVLARMRGGDDSLERGLVYLREVLAGAGIGPVFLTACWTDGAREALAKAHAVGACDAVIDLPGTPVPRETGQYPVVVNSHGLHVVPYAVVAAEGAARSEAARDFPCPLYQAIAIGRDDTGNGTATSPVYRRFSTSQYLRWLEVALDTVRQIAAPQQRFVFLRSWNDWNAGQVLEPDRKSGYGRLNETSRALLGVEGRRPSPKVSVIVPNYNHEPYLRRRLDSIYGQTYRNFEVILMDDCSSDGSRALMQAYADAHPEITQTLFNEENSGGVFRQWAKGIKAAHGDLVWIAESDDYCDERFLEVLVRSFDDEAVLLAYGHCVFVHKDETPMAHEFQTYVSDLECAAKWNGQYVETAHREVRTSLGIKNTIPNASGVLFRRPVDMPLLDEPWWLSMVVAGDWVFYLHLLRGGKIAYDPSAVNYFRRYQGSTAEASYKKAAFYREVGLACREVARLYDVQLAVLERCRDGYSNFYHQMVGNSGQEFEEWFDFDAVLRARAARLPNVMVSTMGFVPGGAEIFPIRLANEFKRLGLSVLLLSSGTTPREDGVRRLLRNDVPVVETADPVRVKALIEDFGVEVLNSHQWFVQKYAAEFPDVFSGLRSHVATLHGMIEHGSAFAVTEQELRAADRSVSTWVYTAEKNLAPFASHDLLQAKESRFLKMPNGIQTTRIETVHRADMHIPDDAFVLCCVSRAIPDKGWAETIASVQRAREISGRDIRLVLVGNGPVHDEYRRGGVPDFVHLVGFSENSAGYYASADMGIMLTWFRSESFPLTIIDCLFAGKPYIATNVGDIRNMLSSPEGVAGAVIELEDWQVPVEAAARAISAFAMDPNRYLVAKALVPQIARRYRIETVASLYIDLFRKAPGRPTFSESSGQVTVGSAEAQV